MRSSVRVELLSPVPAPPLVFLLPGGQRHLAHLGWKQRSHFPAARTWAHASSPRASVPSSVQTDAGTRAMRGGCEDRIFRHPASRSTHVRLPLRCQVLSCARGTQRSSTQTAAVCVASHARSPEEERNFQAGGCPSRPAPPLPRPEPDGEAPTRAGLGWPRPFRSSHQPMGPRGRHVGARGAGTCSQPRRFRGRSASQ